MPDKASHVSINDIKSFVDILNSLQKLDVLLPQDDLGQFVLFNRAYGVVTKAISHSAEAGYFKNPKFIEEITVCFSHYYFRVINSIVAGDQDIPVAWNICNVAAKDPKTPNFIYLMLGANAHINHDLSLALAEIMGKHKTDDLLLDVKNIDKILMQSGREIISLFDEPNRLLNFLKRNFIFLYFRPAMYTILYWRIQAWHGYREIKEHGLDKSNYQHRSIRIAKTFAFIGRLIS